MEWLFVYHDRKKDRRGNYRRHDTWQNSKVWSFSPVISLTYKIKATKSKSCWAVLSKICADLFFSAKDWHAFLTKIFGTKTEAKCVKTQENIYLRKKLSRSSLKDRQWEKVMSTITLLNIVDKRTTILSGTLQDSFGSWITYLRLILPNRRVKIKRVRGTQKNYDRSRLLWRTANSRNVSFDSWNSGQFTLSTQLMMPNYPVILFHRRSTTVPLETYPINYRSQLIILSSSPVSF